MNNVKNIKVEATHTHTHAGRWIQLRLRGGQIMSLIAAAGWLSVCAAVGAQTPPANSPTPTPNPAQSSTPASASSAPASPDGEKPSPPDEPKYAGGIVKMGNELKRTLGVITDVEKGDNGCLLTLKDDKKFEFIEIGLMEICSQKPPLKGQKVELTYKIETIAASSCYGDPKCTKKETVPLVIKVKVLN